MGVLAAFEAFLKDIDLKRHEEKYRPIKTVERNLPPALNPLSDLYTHYWKTHTDNPRFPPYEDFFNAWWESHLKDIDLFIQKFFWGCSYEFVRLGLEARLYRTAVSIWTQFQFCYLWLEKSSFPLEASAELDSKGADALVDLGAGKKVGLQIKKETYRPEARGEGRFLKRVGAIASLEIPYSLTSAETWFTKAERARNPEKKQEYLLWYRVASHLERLPNGFVVFKPSYVERVEAFLCKNPPSGIVTWRELVEKAL